MTAAKTMETKSFETEITQMLELITHSLYSNREIFIRELVSNASDALDKIRFLSLTQKELLENQEKLEIRLTLDSKNERFIITDTGIGMNHDDLIQNIGTIARSGSREFIKSLSQEKKGDLSLIGQFGVGFYSVFMVSKKVEINTRKAGEKESWKWISDGKGTYTLEQGEKSTRGTEIILYLNEDGKEFLEDWKVRSVVRKFSDFVSYDISMPKIDTRSEAEKEKDLKEGKIITQEWEVINSGKALWTRPKKEITDEMYLQFYRHVSHDHEDPLTKIHFSQEGAVTFTSILFIPKHAPFDIFHNPENHGIQLYVKRVFIMEQCKELLPTYLRFAKGIVDTEDLPLNVSREILQQNKVIEKIKKAVTKKLLDHLKEMASKEPEKYTQFWQEHGIVLKEGLHVDYENKPLLSELVRFQSTETDEKNFVSLSEYVKRMKEGQKEIYYITAESRAAAEASPHMEIFRNKGVEVLLLTDPVDEWAVSSLTEFEEKKLVSIVKGKLDLGDITKEEKQNAENSEKNFKSLMDVIRKQFQDSVKDVRTTSRLVDSPCCLVGEENDLSPHLERLMKTMNKGGLSVKKIMEINPVHPIIVHLNNIAEKDSTSAELGEWITLLYDQALLAQGSKLNDPKKYNELLNKLLIKAIH